jgi:hypothetical protein
MPRTVHFRRFWYLGTRLVGLGELAWGSALLAALLSFASPKESKQRKGDPGSVPAAPVPCATRLTRGLRNSGFALKQCSPFIRASLRCSAPLKGPGKASTIKLRISFFGIFPVDRENLFLGYYG